MPEAPTQATHPHLRVRQEGPVLHVTLDNPGRRNAQTPSMWLALGELARSVPPTVRVVVLSGAGPTFSAGLDRAMLAPGGMPGEPDLLGLAAAGRGEELDAAIAAYQLGFSGWRDCPAVVVAAVQGHAVGAGFQLALAADLRVVADDVLFVMAEAHLGMVPDLGGTGPLVAAVGYPRALEVCLTGRAIGAQEAVETGLATVSVPVEQLAAAVADLTEALLTPPVPTARALKTLLAGARSRDAAAQLAAERAAQLPLLVGLARAAREARPAAER
jgi:enoyl-CoA hydratase/carnithine racemase